MSLLDKFGREFMSYPQSKWRQLAFKAPLVLWRMGLGPVLGHHVLVITAKGRKTGLPRHTMTEFHVLNGKIYVPCAFAPKAQWYKNIMADPRVTVQTWQGAEAMTATRVTDDAELLAVTELMRKNNPVMLDWYFDTKGVTPTPEDILVNKDSLYFLRFDATDEPTPFPLEADLAWIWPVLLVLALLKRRKRKS